MSLLMDALKKAEEEKKKSAGQTDPGERAAQETLGNTVVPEPPVQGVHPDPQADAETIIHPGAAELELEPLSGVFSTERSETHPSTDGSQKDESRQEDTQLPPGEAQAETDQSFGSSRSSYGEIDPIESLTRLFKRTEPSSAQAFETDTSEADVGQTSTDPVSFPTIKSAILELDDRRDETRLSRRVGDPDDSRLNLGESEPSMPSASDVEGDSSALDAEGTQPSKRAIRLNKEQFTASGLPMAFEESTNPTGFGQSATHVDAYTVFTSSHKTPPSRVRRFAQFAAVVIFIVVAFVVLYYSLLPETSIAPRVAIDAPRTDRPPSVPDGLMPGATVKSETPTQLEGGALVAPENTLSNPPIAADEPEVAAGSDIHWETKPLPADDRFIQIEPELAGRSITEALDRPISVEPSAIKITRSARRTSNNRSAVDAYRAFLASDYDTAQQSYERILRTKPHHRQALLGLAAVQVQKGSLQQAYRLYSELVRRDPKDPVANAALLNLKNQGGGEISESRLKLLLDQDPASPHLHFSLGNLYAKRARWPEAQQAYFDAYSNDTQNPDYAYNVAVSLDQLGKEEGALDYYKKALTLSDRRSANFGTAEVLTRINTLSNIADRP